jgi:large repetitive protein
MSPAVRCRLRRTFSAINERRTRRLEAGDTLIEVLIALVVLAIASVALIVAFQTSISASSRHRSLANDDTVLTTATQEAITQLQNDSSIWQSCVSESTYPTITMPSPYQSDTINYAVTPGTGTTTPTVEYWDGSGFSSACPSNVATAAQELTIGVAGTPFTNTFVVASPLSISGTSVSTGSANGLIFITDPAGALAGIPFTTQPVLEIESNGYPVYNSLSYVSLTYTPTAGGTSTTFSCPETLPTQTDPQIGFSNCSIPTAGSYTITASVSTPTGTLTATYTPLVVGTANYHLAFTSQPSGAASGTDFKTDPVVAIENSSNGTYTAWTGTVTFTDSGGILSCPGDSSTTTITVTATNGVATMPPDCTFAGGYLYNPVSNVTLATPYTMSVSATGSAPVTPATSNTFAVSSFGAATQLQFTTQPTGVASSSATTVFPGQPVVTVEDSFGNAVTSGFSGTITLTISNPQGLSPPQSLAGCTYGTLTYGVATFSGCHGTATTYGTGYTMTATASGVASATSAPFNISGLATVLLFTQPTGEPIGGLSGSSLARQPVLEYEDSQGNVVTAETAAVSFTVSTTTPGAATGVLSTCTGLAPSGGIVTVQNCSFTGTVGALYYLTATGGGLTATSSAFYVTGAGPLAKLVFETEPAAGAAGSLMTTQPVIYLEDAAGNLETTNFSSISLTSSGGSLTGCSGLSSIDGVVDVSGCTFGGVVNTQYTMTATDGSITGQSADFSPTGPGPLSTITLSGCTTPFNAGTPCQLTATLADAYGNTETTDSSSAVTFGESGTGTVTGLSTVTDSGGIAQDTVTGANAGALTVSATADGLTSNTENLSVYSTSSIAVVTSGTPSVVGQPVTYTATVTPTSTNPAFATGSVEFFNGGAPITGCTAQPLSGTSTDAATCTVTYTSTTGSPHSITAQYLGNPATYFAPSAVSTAITQNVDAAATSTTVVSTTGSPSIVGQPVTYTATVTATAPATGNPTGNVEFFDGGTAITGCTAKALTGTGTDTATCTVTYTATGSHTITAQYLGSAGAYNPSAVSASITQVVTAASSTTSVASSDLTAVVGQSITYTATVAAVSPSTGDPTGNVEFFDGATPITGCTAKALTGTGTDTATCTVVYTSTTPASHSITAVYLGSAGAYNGSTSTAITETVGSASTTTTVASSDTTAVPGETITYTATVAVTAPGSGTPSAADTVTFKDGATTITCGAGSVAFNGTTATCTVVYTSTTPATHSITAVFGGDANYLTSTSSALTESVGKAATTTSVASSDTTAVPGQTITYTATVAVTAPGSGTPSGADTVTFKDGATTITCGAGSVAFNGTTATCTVVYANTTGSPHSITATFNGDANYAASTSSALTETVGKAATTTAVASNANPAVVGQSVALTATISVAAPGAGNPTGTVEFFKGGTPITGCTAQTVATPAETATCATSFTGSGSNTITATYSGDGNFSGSTSPNFTQTVNVGATTTTVTSSDLTANIGQSITYTATVTPTSPAAGNPTGNVEFFDGGTAITGCTAKALTGTGTDTATCTVDYTSTTPPSHSITAEYLGNAGTYSASTSTAITEVVGAAGTTTAVTSSDTTAITGETITYTATVSVTAPGTGTPPATDTVTFKDGATTITCGAGSVAFNGTTATCTAVYTSTTPASHSITAVFNGDANYSASTSTAITESVSAAPTTTVVTSGSNPSVVGQTVTYTATVSVNAPGSGTPPATDTVTFKDNGTTIACAAGSAAFNGTTATCLVKYTATGTHSITAVFSGDANYAASTSTATAQTVNQAATTSFVTSNADPSTTGQTVTYTATIAVTAPGTGTPPATDTVTFKDNGTTIACAAGSAAFNGTTATCLVKYTATGTHPITAVFNGDANYAASTSPADTQTVNGAPTTTAVGAGSSSIVVGQSTTLTATITVVNPGAGSPTGTVDFENAGVGITGCTAQTVSTATETATCTFTPATTGGASSHAITAVYSGDSNFLGSTSPAITETIAVGATSTALASSDTTAVVGEAITYTATVTATAPSTGNPTGSVEFFSAGTAIAGCGGATGEALSGTSPDTATCVVTYATDSPSSVAITSEYLGSTNAYGASALSNSVTESVAADTTTTTVASSVDPSSTYQAVTYTATVTAAAPGTGSPTGNVEFFDGGTAIATCGGATGEALSGTSPDTATCAVTYTATGTHTITAEYLGATNGYTASPVSASISQTVTASKSYSGSSTGNIAKAAAYYPINAAGAGSGNPNGATLLQETTGTTLTSLTVTLSATSTSTVTVTIGIETAGGFGGTFTATALTCTVTAGQTTATCPLGPVSIATNQELEVSTSASAATTVKASWVTTYTQP